MTYEIHCQYGGKQPWMIEGSFDSLRECRKEVKRIVKELIDDGCKFKLRVIKWSATTLATYGH